MATVNLGRIKPVFKGAYAGGTAYVVDDIVTSGNETFICILASTGNATSNATYWTKLASKGADGSDGTDGTNGTDVGTVITTQGDILYRDGSGLQRLAKGTASQVLAINSGATAPEWADASGGAFETIASGTSSNGVIEITNITNDFFVECLNPTNSGGSWLKITVSTDNGSTYKSDTNYQYSSFKTTSDGSHGVEYNSTGEAYAVMGLTGGSFVLTCSQINQLERSNFHRLGSYVSSNSADAGVRMSSGFYNVNQVHNAIKIDFQSSTSVKYTVYRGA